MQVFNRTAFERADQFYRYAEAPEAREDGIASQAAAIRHHRLDRAVAVWTAKRIFDVGVSGFALIVLCPIMLVVMLAIMLDSPGPVFFAQERIGINRRRGERRNRPVVVGLDGRGGDRRRNLHPGRPFRIYKFRTMVRDAERFGPALACERDPRVTRVGRFMRKTRIDELPQFINVIRGDMSIIGPRPERSFFINQVRGDVPEFTMRLLVKPGITGLAQVENGYTSSIDEMKHKLFYDLKYINEFSIWQEIRILFKTVYVVVTGKGAC